MVSNRLPMRVERDKRGLAIKSSVGGLATGLGSFHLSRAQERESLWVGWPGLTAENLTAQERGELRDRLLEERCYPVFLSQKELQDYYYGFCNKTLWPLFHYFPLYTSYEDRFWEAYRRANEAFLEAVAEVVEPGDKIWIHDYHLLLLPGLIRERFPEAAIGFFLHIPFPSSELFRLLPWREPLLEGLLGADLIGFHTYDYLRHFLVSVRRLLGYSQLSAGKLILSVGERVVKVDAFPMGIDYDHFARVAASPEVEEEVHKLRAQLGDRDRKIILSLDRLDYTKGLLQRLEAYDLFLERFPGYRGKVTLVLKAIASRTGIDHYQTMKGQLDELVGRVNGRHGTLDWMPVWYLYRFLPERELIALYRLADVALLTPLRDGMNLIAKEFLAARVDGSGVLILSEMAGAAKELPEALIVNPNNREEIAQAIKTALTMPLEEQRERNRMMQARLRRYNVVRWAEDFLEGLDAIKRMESELAARRLIPSARSSLIQDYLKAERRLLLLDYDGTLIPFAARPEEAPPDEELLQLLEGLAQVPQNEVVIISGRDKATLERYFGNLRVALVAEHGVWLREPQGSWRTIEPLTDEWKEEIHPILELYVDRTPGSILEEKEFSLVWHYRKADQLFADVRLGELKEDLAPLLESRNLVILEGEGVLEVKRSGINKGRAALHWLAGEGWDFVLAVGDDQTDEDTFQVLPEGAYSVKVGLKPSRARFNLDSPAGVRALLRELVAAEARERR